MVTQNMSHWETAIAKVVSHDGNEDVIVRGRKLSELVGKVGFADMMFLVLQGRLPEPGEAKVLEALLVGSVEHGIAPSAMIARIFASSGTSIQQAVGSAIVAFGERRGALGEKLAQLMVERLAALGPDPAAIDEDDMRAAAGKIVTEARAAGKRVPGYGIPLHGADPRAPRILDIARETGHFGPYCRFAVMIEAELTASRRGRAIPMNIDGVGAAVILDLGFDWRTTLLFLIIPRAVSMGAHFIEECDQDTTWRHLPADSITYTGPPASDA